MTIDFLTNATAMTDQLIAWRRDIHKHPELAFEETRTAKIVADELSHLGLEVQTGVGKTGVVGLLSGGSDGPTVLVRCDMDALPMQEANEVAYASVHETVMHACGHDGHTAIGLAVAHLLNQQRSRIQGQIKFVFQPAEEAALGAQAMIDDGVLENPKPDIALGIHLWNANPVGQVAVSAGPTMAGADIFEITIRGRGGHGALPHETRDPLLAATHVVNALQSVISRNINPLDSAVLSVTSFNAGTAFNIIPTEATLKGTIRTYTPQVHDLAISRLHEVTDGISNALGCEAEVTTQQLTPPLVNDATVTRVVSQAVAPYVEPHNVLPEIKTTGAEDMAIFLQHIPGCFLLVGSAAPERGLNYPHHHPQFDFDEAALPLGAAMLASAVATYVIPG
ncbi:M20 family metallopeptidase [Chloroflexota bacterium]